MNQTARIISIYAADTSGFCSALFEYGGMSVIHDASGCNSTYTTHDEPRWYDMDSMMYISGLTESDAVMGNDEKFVTDLVLAAEELKPEFVAICASALPAMVGIDMEAIAYEVESQTNIPSFEVKTNAMQSYITGAGNAFKELAGRFTRDKTWSPASGDADLKVNILGLTPLDFPLHGTCEAMGEWLKSNGLKVNAYVGMHPVNKDANDGEEGNKEKKDTHNLDEIVRLTDANVNLVVSSIGKPLADYLYEKYGIPCVVGTPYGKAFSELLVEDLKKAAVQGENIYSAKNRGAADSNIVVIGESITSASLAAALYHEKGKSPRVLESVGDGDMNVLNGPDDISCTEEDELEKELSKAGIVIADPLFEPICNGKKFIRLPHSAFSGRCFTREEMNLINTSLDKLGV